MPSVDAIASDEVPGLNAVDDGCSAEKASSLARRRIPRPSMLMADSARAARSKYRAGTAQAERMLEVQELRER